MFEVRMRRGTRGRNQNFTADQGAARYSTSKAISAAHRTVLETAVTGGKTV